MILLIIFRKWLNLWYSLLISIFHFIGPLKWNPLTLNRRYILILGLRLLSHILRSFEYFGGVHKWIRRIIVCVISNLPFTRVIKLVDRKWFIGIRILMNPTLVFLHQISNSTRRNQSIFEGISLDVILNGRRSHFVVQLWHGLAADEIRTCLRELTVIWMI